MASNLSKYKFDNNHNANYNKFKVYNQSNILGDFGYTRSLRSIFVVNQCPTYIDSNCI